MLKIPKISILKHQRAAAIKERAICQQTPKR